jgi:hypothetical protein
MVRAAVLADDDEALGFAQRVITELVRSYTIFATGTMEITTGKRIVAHITFESGPKEVRVAAGAAPRGSRAAVPYVADGAD